MKGRHKVIVVFLLLAVLDIGSFIFVSSLNTSLSSFEINPIFQKFGILGLMLAFIALHGLPAYYLYKPRFKSRGFNFWISSFVVLFCIIHAFGTFSNVMAYYNSPTEETTPPQPTQGEKMATLVGFTIFAVLLAAMASYSFRVYTTIADEHELSKIPFKTELKHKIIKKIRENRKDET